jgi:flagellar basal-body rod protein FlgF
LLERLLADLFLLWSIACREGRSRFCAGGLHDEEQQERAMDYGVYMSAAGANVQSRRMEAISHNLANVDTPGFKAELAVIQARASRDMQLGSDYPGSGSINNLGSGVGLVETVTNFSKGAIRKTGAAWDMAIDGDGFFVVEDDGEQLLTRSGNFRLSPNGQLETDQGFAVLSNDGAPVIVDPSLPWTLHEDGFLAQAGGGQYIGLAQPSSPGDLARAGENTFRPLAPVQSVPLTQRKVMGGFLEMSQVKPTRAMMEMIETSRAYEANVRLIQSQDQLTGSLINRILKS